jgi:small GTP-binding protein
MQEIPVVLIGHKDHGKSTLIGRLVLDTKSIKESRVKEIKEVDESDGRKFELAHLVDSFRQEREREMTMDTTRALLKGKDRNYQLIDVPGHSELIANMLTGASNAEAALLLVDIYEGIKEQTRQHLEIAKLLGIEQLGVVVNKIDMINYQKDKFDEITEKLKEILNQIGYLSEKIQFFPVSAWEGDNVVQRSEKTPWYQGPTVMEFLEGEVKEVESFESLPLAFLIQDKYPEGEKEVLVGPVETGAVKVGQEIVILPNNEKVKIESIRDSEGELSEAKAGQNIGISLGVKGEALRGGIISSLNNNFQTGNELEGEMFWIDKPSQENLILECGTAKVEATLEEPKEIQRGTKTPYKAQLKKTIAFEPNSKTILGKIVLKEEEKSLP